MLTSSKAHLTQVNERYFQHMRFAMVVGTLAVGAGLACMLHAFVPGICERTCSRTVGSLQWLFDDRARLEAVLSQNSALLIFTILVLISVATAVVVAVCTAGSLICLVVIPQAFALPIIFLSQNPELDPVIT